MLFEDIYTKSETYQKEGWFILEEENQVFGKDAEAVDSNINLESEDFKFYHQNKEEAKKNIDSSSKELTDFIDSLIQDIPDPSEDEVAEGVKKILEKTHSDETKDKTSKSNKTKKVTFKVLFIAALLSMISFSCLYVVGSSHNISIENGFVSFAKDTIQVVFFGEDKEEYITIDALLTDLELHGYSDVLFPQECIVASDDYKTSIPKYSAYELNDQVSFKVSNSENNYEFNIRKIDISDIPISYNSLENAETISLNGVYIYIFEFDDTSTIEFNYDGIYYSITSKAHIDDMVKFAKSIK